METDITVGFILAYLHVPTIKAARLVRINGPFFRFLVLKLGSGSGDPHSLSLSLSLRFFEL